MKRYWLGGKCHRSRSKPPRRRPAVEVLEDRTLPATFTVLTTVDNGDSVNPTPGSLRQALREASLTAEQDTIVFNIPGAGVQTIRPPIALPAIQAGGAIIDGTTQPGYAGVPLIELDGSQAVGTPAPDGLVLFSGPSVVKGLIINRFSGNGINITTAAATIQGCWIGLDSTGTGSAGNLLAGVASTGPTTVIGGSQAGQGNIISGNVQQGVYIPPSITGAKVIEGNWIGLNAQGTLALPNGTSFPTSTARAAVFIGTPNVRVSGNVISGNAATGIEAGTSQAGTAITIQGNLIGLTAAGTAPLANNGNGILIGGANGVIIGGTDPAARNVVSGNTQAGIAIFAPNTQVLGNYVGTNATGTAAIPNATAGVVLSNPGSTTPQNTVVGGTAPGARNLIAGNTGPGVRVERFHTGSSIRGNWIGLDADGTGALANQTGVSILGTNITVADNVISGNAGAGVLLGTDGGHTVRGNRIGTRPDGTTALANSGVGVMIDGVNNNLVGGAGAGEGNSIAFNSTGVLVRNGTGNAVRGNTIFSNSGLGIDLDPSGVTLNDFGDTDTGSNLRQNFPVLTGAVSAGGTTNVTGSLASAPLRPFTLDFYSVEQTDIGGYGEGAVYLGSAVVQTDGLGSVMFQTTLNATVPLGHFVTATATDTANNTSEFSVGRQVTSTAGPVVTDVGDQAAFEDLGPVVIPFQVLDPDTPTDALVVTVSSSNPALLPAGSLILGGSGSNRTLTATPASNQSGNALITLSISDGTTPTTDTFFLRVAGTNDPPVLLNNTGLTVPQPGATVVLTSAQLLATDPDSPIALNYIVTALPANGSLQKNGVPLAIGNTFTPADVQFGSIQYVHNGGMTLSDQFRLDVTDERGPRVELASHAPAGDLGNGGSDFEPAISGDGRFVAFWSNATNLIADDVNGFSDIFLLDRQTNQIERVSVTSGGAHSNGNSGGSNTWRLVDVSDDGNIVAFTSDASNLVGGDSNGAKDIFVRDRLAGITSRVSVGSGGIQANGTNSELSMSADGNLIVFASNANNLTTDADQTGADVYLHDRRTGLTVKVSKGLNGATANGDSDTVAISADGRFVTFISSASNLVAGDTNGRVDIFIYDVPSGIISLASVDSTGAQANNNSDHPTISGDGRFVVFESAATNLSPDDTNNRTDVFIRDRLTGATTRIPSPPATTGLDYDSLRPSVSYDGRYVAFQYGTTSTQPGREEDVWVYDRMTGQNSEVSVNALGVSSDRDAERAAISGDGQTVLFTTSATNLVPGVTGNTFRQVFMAKPDVVAVTVNVAAPVPQTLRVDSFMPTATGFIATFTQPLETTALNLYDSASDGLTPADVVLTDQSGSLVRGSLVVEPDGRSIRFVRTGGALATGNYVVVLRSASDGFKAAGPDGLLDGNGDGTPGDNYTTTFMASSATTVVSVSDFARGPGQPIDVPSLNTGLPLRLTSAGDVTALQFNFRYNANLLQVAGFTRGAGLPADAVLTVDTAAPGVVNVQLTRATPLPAGVIELLRLTATVPDSATYGLKHLLDIADLQANGGALAASEDDGVHVVAYLGDASGNARITATDATLTLRAAVGLDSGFSRYPLADPVIVADVTGNGRLDATDATRLLQEAVGFDRPEVPNLPANPPTVPASGPDPLLSLPQTLHGRPGATLTVPLLLDVSEDLHSADLALSYDTQRLELQEVQRGTLTGDFDLLLIHHDAAAGTVRVGLGRSAGPITGRGSGSVLLLRFRIRDEAPAGRAVINLRQAIAGTTTQLNEGGLDLNPDPSDRAGDALDGVIGVLTPKIAQRQAQGVERFLDWLRQPEVWTFETPRKRRGNQLTR